MSAAFDQIAPGLYKRILDKILACLLIVYLEERMRTQSLLILMMRGSEDCFPVYFLLGSHYMFGAEPGSVRLHSHYCLSIALYSIYS